MLDLKKKLAVFAQGLYQRQQRAGGSSYHSLPGTGCYGPVTIQHELLWA